MLAFILRQGPVSFLYLVSYWFFGLHLKLDLTREVLKLPDKVQLSLCRLSQAWSSLHQTPVVQFGDYFVNTGCQNAASFLRTRALIAFVLYCI